MAKQTQSKKTDTQDDEPPAAPPMVIFRSELQSMLPEIRKALPRHVSADRFQRVVQTAVNGNPQLLDADRRSLFQSCIQCAQDGLVPDGREAAFVTFNTKVKINGREVWIDKVQYMPMVTGIIKRCRNSGDIKWISAESVYAADEFSHYTDETGEHFKFVRNIDADDRGRLKGAFAAALTKDGTLYFEFLTKSEIDTIKSVSRAGSGEKAPWVKWFDEMAEKSAIRRLAKRLPMSTEQEQLIQRDDDMYDLSAMPQVTAPPKPTRQAIKDERAAAERMRKEQEEHLKRHGSGDGGSEPIDVEHEEVEDEEKPKTDDTPHDSKTGEVLENDEKPKDDTPPDPDAVPADFEPKKVADMLLKKILNADNPGKFRALRDDYERELKHLEKSGGKEWKAVHTALEGKRTAMKITD